MMKHIIFMSALMLISTMTGEAIAGASNCSSNQVTGTALFTLLDNSTVCQAAGTDEPYGAQEEHRSGGQLWDYKRGPSSTIDPPTQIGNWQLFNANGQSVQARVQYTYLGGGGGGTYKVYNNLDGTYDFCNGTTRVATASVIKPIPSDGCPGFTHGAP
jgi:hypothetical protein